MKCQNELILFFLKYPEPGRVKTRLAASIGPEEAAELYGNFILDILAKLKSSSFPFRICFHPKQKRKSLVEWLGEEYQYSLQEGNDLGERMKAAFLEAFASGYQRVILIGSDFPDFPISFLKESLDALKTHDTVVGPAVDGGYYLIGFREDTFFPGIFEGMDWGTDVIFRETLSKLRDHKQRVYVLPAWEDIDTVENLEELIRRSEGTDFSNSKTMSYLCKNRIGKRFSN